MVISDRRSDEQKKTHVYWIVARDNFMSGWGAASDGYSWAAWAHPTMREAVDNLDKIKGRPEMRYVRIVDGRKYRPSRTCSHLSIYVGDE
jgi:hypothetical protein